jgi:hypothetical protein
MTTHSTKSEHTKSTKSSQSDKATKPAKADAVTPAVPSTTAETAAAADNGASILQVAPPAPTQHAPAVPANFDLTQRVGRGAGIWPTLATLAGPMATEVKSSSTFADDFGTKVDQTAFAEALSTVAAWRDELDRANDWAAYVRAGSAANTRSAQKQLERFRGAFEHAASIDPTVAKRYPQLTEVYRSQSMRGTRAANTRANNKKAKGAATTSTTPNAEATTAHAAVGAAATTTTPST